MKNLIILISFLTTTLTISAHPHLFIKPEIGFVHENGLLTGLRVTWEWDKWWSTDVILYCDLNKDGLFNNEERKMVYDDFFSGISEFNFFCDIRINGKRIPVKKVENFDVLITSKDIVTYYYTIPISTVKTPTYNIAISFDDETIYAAFDDIRLDEKGLKSINDLQTSIRGFYGRHIKADITLE